MAKQGQVLVLTSDLCLFPAFSGGRTWEMIGRHLLSEPSFSRLCKEIFPMREKLMGSCWHSL